MIIRRPSSRDRAAWQSRTAAHVDHRRRGLAPLEFVLVLPLLLFVMALIIDFGFVAQWKLRGTVVSRQAVWRQRYPRTGANDPRPPGWPNAAAMFVANGGNLLPDPFTAHNVVRGPVIVDPETSNSLLVNPGLLDFNTDVKTGRSQINRSLPLLPRLDRVRYNLQHPLVDSRWQYGEMGFSENDVRRMPSLYPQLRYDVFFDRVPVPRQAHLEAISTLLQAPFRPDLFPLDRDDEFIAYYGGNDPDYRPPEFHPLVDTCQYQRISRGHYNTTCQACLLDEKEVRELLIDSDDGLIKAIQGRVGGGNGGVPEVMANRFLDLYNSQIGQLLALDPPPQAQIQQLRAKVAQLQQFLNMLR